LIDIALIVANLVWKHIIKWSCCSLCIWQLSVLILLVYFYCLLQGEETQGKTE